MGLLVSKSIDNEGWSSHATPTKKQRSLQGACPSNRVFPTSLNPLIVDDLQSNGTESSRGSPDSSYYGRNGSSSHHGDVSRYPGADVAATTNSSRAWRFWRDFYTPKHAAPTQDGVVEEDRQLHPQKIYIPTPRREPQQRRTEPVPVIKHLTPHESLGGAVMPQSLDHDDSERLQTLYDLRTWALYSRITDARSKQSAPKSHHIAHASQHARSQGSGCNLQQQDQGRTDVVVVSMNASGSEEFSTHGHSFIFGELE
ncbi:hypothetical protein MPSEU_000147900 [Mayamaea pseudoterrestris]|nr:hypothetical protein MPSEU_000147900 [Mayamaea pseudoterrestris]